jgi:hypothetical protein
MKAEIREQQSEIRKNKGTADARMWLRDAQMIRPRHIAETDL